MGRPKILICSDSLACGGKERQLAQLIRYLADCEAVEVSLMLMENKVDFGELNPEHPDPLCYQKPKA